MISFKEEPKAATYKESLGTLWTGTRQLACCYAATMAAWALDTMKYMARHFVFVAIIAVALISMVVVTMSARAERDHYNKIAYHLERQCDSLKIIIGK